MNYYLILAGTLLAYMTCWFFVSVFRKRNDVADIAWGLGFVLLSWASFFLSRPYSLKGILVDSMVSVWGIRLALHIYNRNKGKPEDYRYVSWRKEWGNWFYLRSFFQVYLLQGVFLFLIVLPVLLINRTHAAQLGFSDAVGVLIWLTGFYFESAGDAQLVGFIKDPANKGKIMDQGLWRYTRHPNYFGEITQWWGIWILAASVSNGLYTIIGPLTITCLILFVSGIPMLERKYAGRPDFEAYKQRTSVLLPLPPKKY